jgi:hypothetical protein
MFGQPKALCEPVALRFFSFRRTSRPQLPAVIKNDEQQKGDVAVVKAIGNDANLFNEDRRNRIAHEYRGAGDVCDSVRDAGAPLN